MKKIDEIRAMVDACTEGPWYRLHKGSFIYVGPRSAKNQKNILVEGDDFEDNSDFIAASRTLVPLLLDVVNLQDEGLEIIEHYPLDKDEEKELENMAWILLKAKQARAKAKQLLDGWGG